jgi:predicted O-methyltransferase YrrM
LTLQDLNLFEIEDYAVKNHVPIIQKESAKMLFDIIKNNDCLNILEIGTAIGYSGIIMLNANINAKLTTIEINEERAKIAKDNFFKLNLENRVNLIINDAYDAIKNLELINLKFDFIFLDGPKGQYLKYFSVLKNIISKNGIIFADNVNFRGLVNSNQKIDHKFRTIVVNMRKFIEVIKNDENFKTEIFNVGDGVAIIKKVK